MLVQLKTVSQALRKLAHPDGSQIIPEWGHLGLSQNGQGAPLMLHRSNSDPNVNQLQCITEAGIKTKGARAKMQHYLSNEESTQQM